MTPFKLSALKPLPAVALKVAIYTRVSTEEQVDGFSLGYQADACHAFAQKLGATSVELYQDAGFSGTNTKRPAFQRLIEDAESGLFGTVLVYRGDRFSRSQLDSLMFKERLKKAGVQLIAVTEPFDDTPSGFIGEGMMRLIAEFFSRDLRLKVTTALRKRADTGLMNGLPPFGYRQSDHPQWDPPVIVPDEADAVRQAYEWFASGTMAYKEIAERFNAMGLRTRHRPTKLDPDGPRLWTGDTIRGLIQNPVYRGSVTYKGEELPGKHAPIVTDELWRQANTVGSRLRVRNTTWKPVHAYALAGILKCSGCGSNLQGNFTNSGERFRYYREVGKRRGLPCEQPQIAVRADRIEAEVDRIVAGFKTPPAVRKRVLQLLNEDASPEDVEAKQRQLQERLRRLARLYELAEMADVEYDGKRRALQAELDRVTLPPRKADEAISQFDVLQLAWSRATPQEKRALGLALFEAIYYDLAAMAITEVVVQPAFRPWVQR